MKATSVAKKVLDSIDDRLNRRYHYKFRPAGALLFLLFIIGSLSYLIHGVIERDTLPDGTDKYGRSFLQICIGVTSAAFAMYGVLLGAGLAAIMITFCMVNACIETIKIPEGDIEDLGKMNK